MSEFSVFLGANISMNFGKGILCKGLPTYKKVKVCTMPVWSVCNILVDSYDGSQPQDISNHKMGIFQLNNRNAILIVTSFKANSGIDFYYKNIGSNKLEVYIKHDAQYGSNAVTLLSDPSITYSDFSFNLADASSVDFSTLTQAAIIDL